MKLLKKREERSKNGTKFKIVRMTNLERKVVS